MELWEVTRHSEKQYRLHLRSRQKLRSSHVWRRDQHLDFFKTKTSKQEFEREQKQVEKLHVQLGEFSGEYDVPFNSKIVKNGRHLSGYLNLQNRARLIS